MRVTTNVHAFDDTAVKGRILWAASGQAVPVLNIGSDVSIFVTRDSVAQIAKAAAQLMKQMDDAERAVPDAAEAVA